MDFELSGRRALATGASSGIGLATARLLAAEGCDVAIVARDRQRLDAAAQRIRAGAAGRVIAISADTGDDSSVAAMASEVEAELGGVDVLVNCAATPNTGAPMSDDRLEEEINVKVRGYLRCVRALTPGMVERGCGRVINISGLAARRTGTIVGSVRNVAVAAMTKNLADELGPSGVNCTTVYPNFTVTENTPAALATMAAKNGTTPEAVEAKLAARVSTGRLITADEVATVIVFLASPRSVALNGDVIAASGGERGSISY